VLIVDVHLKNARRVVQAGNAQIAGWMSAVVGSGARGRVVIICPLPHREFYFKLRCIPF